MLIQYLRFRKRASDYYLLTYIAHSDPILKQLKIKMYDRQETFQIPVQIK